MKAKASFIKHILQESYYFLLGLLWLTGLVVGYLGFSRYAADNQLSMSISDRIYSTVQLIVLESGSVTGIHNWMLDSARFLLPALTLYTAVQAFLLLFREQTQWARLWRMRNHIIVCGLGKKGNYLVRQLLDQGYTVVVLERELGDKDTGFLENRGAILLKLDATLKESLKKARLHYASQLVCLLGEDSQNLKIAAHAYKIKQEGTGRLLTCVIHLSSPDLLELIEATGLCLLADSNLQVEIFNPYYYAARLLTEEVSECQDSSEHANLLDNIFLLGMERLGTSLILEAAYDRFQKNHRARMNITILDPYAKNKTDQLIQEYPQLSDVCVLSPIDVNLQSTSEIKQSIEMILKRNSINRIYICLGDTTIGLQLCVNLLQNPLTGSIPIWVRVSKNDPLLELVTRPIMEQTDNKQVRMFDFYEHTCSATLVTGGLHEQLARNLYLNSCGEYGSTTDYQISNPAWDQLPEVVKESHRWKANHIQKVLKSGGYRISPLQNWDARNYTFSPDEVERMARQEYALWQQEMTSNAVKKKGKKESDGKNPLRVSWDLLPVTERENKRQEILQLNSLLSQIGYQVVKIGE